MSGRARTTIEESARTTPTARARAATRGRAAAGLITELPRVLAAVLPALRQHLFDVGPGFGEGDLLDGEVRSAPIIGVAGAGVVGGERGRLVAVIAVEQFPQQEGSVANIDFGVSQVLQFEARSFAVLSDRVSGVGSDLHQPARSRARFLVLELRLGVDHGGDQRRVDVLFGGLLADHVLVAQRQRQLLDRVVEGAVGDQEGEPEPGEDGEPAEGGAAAAGTDLAPHPRSFSSKADSARSSSSTEPSLATTCSARSAFSGWVSCRASRSSTRACPRAAARSRRTSSAATTATVVSKAFSLPASKRSGTSTTATSVPAGRES